MCFGQQEGRKRCFCEWVGDFRNSQSQGPEGGGYEGKEAIIDQLLPTPFRPEIEDLIPESVQRQSQKVRIEN